MLRYDGEAATKKRKKAVTTTTTSKWKKRPSSNNNNNKKTEKRKYINLNRVGAHEWCADVFTWSNLSSFPSWSDGSFFFFHLSHFSSCEIEINLLFLCVDVVMGWAGPVLWDNMNTDFGRNQILNHCEENEISEKSSAMESAIWGVWMEWYVGEWMRNAKPIIPYLIWFTLRVETVSKPHILFMRKNLYIPLGYVWLAKRKRVRMSNGCLPNRCSHRWKSLILLTILILSLP